MSKQAQDQVVYTWGSLMHAARRDEAELAGVAPFLEPLERAHAQVQVLRSQRDSLLAAARETTQQLNQALAAGADAAICLRAFIKSVLGHRTEKLLRYGIKPRRGRGA